MFKVAIDAGHGGFGVTPGKRTPDNEYEWNFNKQVAEAFIDEINNYENVEAIRTDDPTGKTDVSLEARVYKANSFGANAFISFHHNAYLGTWGTHTGTETWTPLGSNPNSEALAAAVQPALVSAYGLYDRGLKKEDWYVIKYTKMAAILVEGGYMDSTIDIVKLRDSSVLKNAGVKAAQAVAKLYNLKRKAVSEPTGDIYKVESGDTLWGISVSTKVSVDNLKAWNNLSSDTIYPGQVLVLSAPKTVAKPVPKPVSSGIKSVGKIEVANLNNFTYIYQDTSDSSKRLAKAKKGARYSIAGSVKGWYEIIYKGKRAYIKSKYAKRV